MLGVPRPCYSYPVGDSEVPWCSVSVSCVSPAGDTRESRAEIPKLSDCHDMGTAMPPRSGAQTGRTVKSVLTLTRFTPVLRTRRVLVCERIAERFVSAVNGGILPLTKDRIPSGGAPRLMYSRRPALRPARRSPQPTRRCPRRFPPRRRCPARCRPVDRSS